MFIAPFLGDMVGDELNNKNFDFGEIRHANDTRLPGSDTLPTRIKGQRGGVLAPPAHPPDTHMTRLTRAIFGVP